MAYVDLIAGEVFDLIDDFPSPIPGKKATMTMPTTSGLHVRPSNQSRSLSRGPSFTVCDDVVRWENS